MVIPSLRSISYVVVLITVVFLGSSLHSCGVKSGAKGVQTEWDKEKSQTLAAIKEWETRYNRLESDHRIETQRIAHELAEERRYHEVELARADAEHQRRLRLSETRAEIYQRQAEGGSTQCRDLAVHAGRLDASLEEGRSLVRELRNTLGFREQQLRSMSQQLLNDRALFDDQEDQLDG